MNFCGPKSPLMAKRNRWGAGDDYNTRSIAACRWSLTRCGYCGKQRRRISSSSCSIFAMEPNPKASPSALIKFPNMFSKRISLGSGCRCFYALIWQTSQGRRSTWPGSESRCLGFDLSLSARSAPKSQKAEKPKSQRECQCHNFLPIRTHGTGLKNRRAGIPGT